VRVTPGLNSLWAVTICPKDSVQSYPSVVFNGENYVIVWSDKNFGNSHCYVAAARVSTSGSVLDPGACISDATGDDERPAHIAFDGNRCLVVWKKAGAVLGRFLNAQCQTEGNIFQIANNVAGGHCIAFDSTNYLIVWLTSESPNFLLNAQFVSTSGNLIGSEFTIVVDTIAFTDPEIIFSGTDYCVVWAQPFASDPVIRGQFVATDGSLIGSSFTISDTGTNYRRDDPAIAASDSNYLVVWDEYRSPITSDLYGNVDILLSSVEEDSVPVNISLPYNGTLILAGPLRLPENKGCKVFDITGCQIYALNPAPGIYFIEVDGKIHQKVVKVK